MKKHICYLFITLLTAMSLPMHAQGLNEKPDVVASQEIYVVDINQADVEKLALLKGVGVKRAQAIVDYRELNGSFTSIDELLNVKGIGEQMLHLNKERIKL